METYSPSRRRRLMNEINVVPYIDVMLVLLIVFMVSAPLLIQGVQVSLPQIGGPVLNTNDSQSRLIVTIDREGRYFVNIGDETEPLNEQALRARVGTALRSNPQTVYFRGDESISYGRLAAAWVLMTELGATDFKMLFEPPPVAQ